MAIAGERIGYLAISPRLAEAAALRNACTFANRILGYVNAPAIWQRVVAEVPDAMVDVRPVPGQARPAVRCADGHGLRRAAPARLVLRFPRTPIADDVAFIRLCRTEGILAVPGSASAAAATCGLSLTITLEEIERSLAGFERAIRAVR